jgi:hypothetical protein
MAFKIASRRRHLLLVGLDHLRPKDPPISLATASLAAASADVCEVGTLTANTVCEDVPSVVARVCEAVSKLPDCGAGSVVGIGGFIWAEHYIPEILKGVRKSAPADCTIVMGGRARR